MRCASCLRLAVAKADTFCDSRIMDSDRSQPSELPQAYWDAFEVFMAEWPPARRALGLAVLSWLLETPPMNSCRPWRPGDELEWRLITDAEWYAMRRALAVVSVTI